MRADEFRGTIRTFQIARIVHKLGPARKGRNHQTIPRRNDLVVEMRARTFAADRQQFFATTGESLSNFVFAFLKMFRGLCNCVALDQNVFAAKLLLRIAALRGVAMRLHA